MSRITSSNSVNVLIFLLLPISILAHIFWLPESISVPAISDAGYVSIITLTFLGCSLLALLTLVFNINFESKLTAASAAYVIAIYFLREADIHRLLTIEHVTRGKFYTMQSVPMWQKIFAGAVLILFAICLLYLLFRYVKVVWRRFRDLESWSVALFLWFAILFISQLCDKSGLNDIHIGRVIEENSECWAAIFLFLAIVQIIPTLRFCSIETATEIYTEKTEESDY